MKVESIKNTKSDITYPSILERVKAAFIDSVILVLLMFVISDLFSTFEHIPDQIRMIAFIAIFGLYDPILTSFFGGTIGHKVNGLQVKSEKNEKKNISLLSAIIRSLLKIFLGWISLLTIGRNIKKKAIHDIAVNSIVLFNKKP